jgi:hypothetical protein
MPLALYNDRGEQVQLPPEGVTLHELLASFGNCRLAMLPEAVAQDQAAADPDAATLQREEINGLIEEPDVKQYIIVQRATYPSTITTFTAALSAGSATVRLSVDVDELGTFLVTTTENTWSINLPFLVDRTLRIEVLSASSAEGLAFTMGFTR